MKLEAAEDHTPCNVNTREKQLDPRQEEKNQEKSLQTEVNVTRAKIRNLIGFKGKKKVRVINYTITCTKSSAKKENLISQRSFFNYPQSFGILPSIISDLCEGKPLFSKRKNFSPPHIIGLGLLPLIKTGNISSRSREYLKFLDKQQL